MGQIAADAKVLDALCAELSYLGAPYPECRSRLT
jgi:hypothetical protein